MKSRINKTWQECFPDSEVLDLYLYELSLRYGSKGKMADAYMVVGESEFITQSFFVSLSNDDMEMLWMSLKRMNRLGMRMTIRECFCGGELVIWGEKRQ